MPPPNKKTLQKRLGSAFFWRRDFFFDGFSGRAFSNIWLFLSIYAEPNNWKCLYRYKVIAAFKSRTCFCVPVVCKLEYLASFISENPYWPNLDDMTLRPFFFDYLVYGSADPILQDLKKKKNYIFFFNLFICLAFFFFFFFFLQIFSCKSKALKMRRANTLWSPGNPRA